MHKQPIFFEKNGKVYEAQSGATIKNITDNVFTDVSVSEILDLGNNKYGILLFSAKPGWDKQFDVDSVESI